MAKGIIGGQPLPIYRVFRAGCMSGRCVDAWGWHGAGGLLGST